MTSVCCLSLDFYKCEFQRSNSGHTLMTRLSSQAKIGIPGAPWTCSLGFPEHADVVHCNSIDTIAYLQSSAFSCVQYCLLGEGRQHSKAQLSGLWGTLPGKTPAEEPNGEALNLLRFLSFSPWWLGWKQRILGSGQKKPAHLTQFQLCCLIPMMSLWHSAPYLWNGFTAYFQGRLLGGPNATIGVGRAVSTHWCVTGVVGI